MKIYRTGQTVAMFPEMLCRRIKEVLASGQLPWTRTSQFCQVWSKNGCKTEVIHHPSDGLNRINAMSLHVESYVHGHCPGGQSLSLKICRQDDSGNSNESQGPDDLLRTGEQGDWHDASAASSNDLDSSHESKKG